MDKPYEAQSRAKPILQVQELQVYYGESHALQGVSLTLERGVLSVVGRNGMGKTTLCNAVVGLMPVRAGAIRFEGRNIVGVEPHVIARAGVGYVPQGRRLWPSLSVEDTLRLSARTGGAWTVERVYSIFPRLAERRTNGGGQLSGGEQQMLAIGRALLGNPRLLVMDEPTEGLAPMIVAQVRDLLIRLAHEEDLSVLVVEQNIGVATSVSDHVAIMVNGRVNRMMDASALAADRDLQQRLLGVGRHGHDETDAVPAPAASPDSGAVPVTAQVFRIARNGEAQDRDEEPVYRAESLPNRWGLRLGGQRPPHVDQTSGAEPPPLLPLPFSARIGRTALVVGTFDTKGAELRFIRDRLRSHGVAVRTVDLSTSGKPSRADVTPAQVAAMHPNGSAAVFSSDRGASVTAMAEAFARWIEGERGVGGVISAGGSGGTSLATAGMRRLPLGIPKVMVSTVASGQVAPYVGASDIMMLYSVADVQGVNGITEQVLGNAAHALAGMIAGAPLPEEREAKRRLARPAIGLTMFGVTTPAVQGITRRLESDFDCLVFHATGAGGRSMESLADSGLLAGFIDLTTTEVADMLVGGVFPCDADRFGAAIRTRLPCVVSVGALDMVNFGPRESVPDRFRGRRLVVHNPTVTLMRTTAEENRAIGEWIGDRLNRMEGEVRLLLPEGGVSALDAPGKPFHDPDADAALFGALEQTVRRTQRRRIERIRANLNDDAFVSAATSAFLAIGPRRERRA